MGVGAGGNRDSHLDYRRARQRGINLSPGSRQGERLGHLPHRLSAHAGGTNSRAVPVEDDDGQLCGILRYFDLLKLLLPEDTEGISVRTVHASLADLGHPPS